MSTTATTRVAGSTLIGGPLKTSLDSSDSLELEVFFPEPAGSVTAEFNLYLKGGLNVLHVVVEHGHGDDRGEGGDGGDGDSKEGQLFQALGLANFLLHVHDL